MKTKRQEATEFQIRAVLYRTTVPHDCYRMRRKLKEQGVDRAPEEIYKVMKVMQADGRLLSKMVPDGPTPCGDTIEVFWMGSGSDSST